MSEVSATGRSNEVTIRIDGNPFIIITRIRNRIRFHFMELNIALRDLSVIKAALDMANQAANALKKEQ